MSRRHALQTARRVKAATVRIEQQIYDYASAVRAPRLLASVATGYCQLNSTLNAASGSWPSISPTNTSGVTIYTGGGGSLNSIATNAHVYNYRNVTWNSGKTTFVVQQGGVWHVIDQDC